MKSSVAGYSDRLNGVDQGIIELKARIYPGKITRYLLTVVGILTLLSLVGHLSLYLLPDFPGRELFSRKFALNEEQNFPTLYSALALFFCSVLFGMIAFVKTNTKNYYRYYWQGLSVIFTFLALDELLTLHEHLSKPLHKLGVDGILHNAWVIPGGIAVTIFMVIFYRFFMHLPRSTKRLFLIAVSVFLGGAIFIEVIGGAYKFIHGEDNLGYALITTVEEVMEMLGVVVLIHALLTYITQLEIHQINFNFNLTRKNSIDS